MNITIAKMWVHFWDLFDPLMSDYLLYLLEYE